VVTKTSPSEGQIAPSKYVVMAETNPTVGLSPFLKFQAVIKWLKPVQRRGLNVPLKSDIAMLSETNGEVDHFSFQY